MTDVERVARALCRATDGPECSVVCDMCLRDAQAALREVRLIDAEALHDAVAKPSPHGTAAKETTMHDEPIFRAGETVRLKRTGSLWTVCVGHRPGLPAVYQNPSTGGVGYVVSLKAQPDLLHIYPASALERMDDAQ